MAFRLGKLYTKLKQDLALQAAKWQNQYGFYSNEEQHRLHTGPKDNTNL